MFLNLNHLDAHWHGLYTIISPHSNSRSADIMRVICPHYSSYCVAVFIFTFPFSLKNHRQIVGGIRSPRLERNFLCYWKLLLADCATDKKQLAVNFRIAGKAQTLNQLRILKQNPRILYLLSPSCLQKLCMYIQTALGSYISVCYNRLTTLRP